MPAGAHPAFSVIVPAYDAEQRIATVVRSVLAQTEPDLELIIVDDGSTDGTLELARSLAAPEPRISVIAQPNRGTVAARTAGVEAARGRYLSFLDDDDLWLPGYLAAVRRLLDSDPDVGIAHTDAWVLDAASRRISARTAHEQLAAPLRRLPNRLEPDAAERVLLRVNVVTTCACTVRAEALHAVGGLDAGLVGTDDWDLWIRIAAAGWALSLEPAALAVLRKRTQSVSSDETLMAENARLVLVKALARGTRTAPAARTARRHLRLIDAELAATRAQGITARLQAKVARSARRLGRRRPPPLRGRRPRQPPAIVTETLERCEQASSATG